MMRFSVVLVRGILFKLLLFAIFNTADGASDTLFPYGYLVFSPGVNMNFHLPDFGQLPGIPSCCPEYNNSVSLTPHVTFSYEWLQSPLKHIIIEAGLNIASVDFQREEYIGNVLIIPSPSDSPRVEPALVNHVLQTSLYAADFILKKPILKLSSTELLAGLGLQFFFRTQFEQQEQLIEPTGVTFTNGKRVRNEYSGNISEFSKLQPSIILSIRSHLPAGKQRTLTPFATLQFSPTSLSSVNWHLFQLYAGVSFRLPLLPQPIQIHRDTLYQRDTTVKYIVGLDQEEILLISRSISEDTVRNKNRIVIRTWFTEEYERRVPRVPPLRATFKVFTITESRPVSVDTLHIQEQEIYETLPLLPFIYFRHGDSLLTTTRLHLLLPDQTWEFDPSSLPPDPFAIYAELLNIIGFRMRQYPQSQITIIGCNNNYGIEKNNTTLSKARAEKIKEYLTTVWGIDPIRIRTMWRNLPSKPTNPDIPEGREENSRAEIISDDFNILAPLRLRQLQYTASPQELYFEIHVLPPNIPKTWELTVTSDKAILHTSSGQDTIPSPIRWSVPPDSLVHSSHLNVTVAIQDQFAQQYDSTTSLPIKFQSFQMRRTLLREGKIVEIFSLILFDFDQGTLTDAHIRILENVVRHILPSSKIKIYGYTDQIGSQEYNKNLALRRCTEVAQFLQRYLSRERIELYPIGSSEELYDNTLPEGRAYSRTVRIIVETPLTKP